MGRNVIKGQGISYCLENGHPNSVKTLKAVNVTWTISICRDDLVAMEVS